MTLYVDCHAWETIIREHINEITSTLFVLHLITLSHAVLHVSLSFLQCLDAVGLLTARASAR